ncbi:contact-dependent growth inhibition system immunity protein [Bacillus mexicanus]|uniref:contact-dependent growth inhibition system immunity protein n=1 Tax=Bacillus mexicanus TaxID=2834415 RepID=UPI001CDC8D02
MYENDDNLEELSDFLEGTFHQDIGSPEQALEEFIAESSKECLVFTIKCCEGFLNKDIPDQEKESFIKLNSEIYFPAIDSTPLQWLKKVIAELKEASC